jgi:hypothetical protein
VGARVAGWLCGLVNAPLLTMPWGHAWGRGWRPLIPPPLPPQVPADGAGGPPRRDRAQQPPAAGRALRRGRRFLARPAGRGLPQGAQGVGSDLARPGGGGGGLDQHGERHKRPPAAPRAGRAPRSVSSCLQPPPSQPRAPASSHAASPAVYPPAPAPPPPPPPPPPLPAPPQKCATHTLPPAVRALHQDRQHLPAHQNGARPAPQPALRGPRALPPALPGPGRQLPGRSPCLPGPQSVAPRRGAGQVRRRAATPLGRRQRAEAWAARSLSRTPAPLACAPPTGGG